MVNMDYPGPCFSCSAIDVCSSEESKIMAYKWYCNEIEGDLSVWKESLHDAAASFMDIKSDERARILDAVAEIKSLARDIESKVLQLEAECPLDVRDDHVGGRYEKAMEVLGAGSFGG